MGVLNDEGEIAGNDNNDNNTKLKQGKINIMISLAKVLLRLIQLLDHGH